MTENLPRLIDTNAWYWHKILNYHGIKYRADALGEFLYIQGFEDYNNLHKINCIFSTMPQDNVYDRTNTLSMPYNFHIARAYRAPSKHIPLAQCFENRVLELEKKRTKINILWSGGIDSTGVVVAFLRFSSNRSNIRIVYNHASAKENPKLLAHLLYLKDVELVDFSIKEYLRLDLDGIFVNGDGSDDLTASLDLSFFDIVKYKGMMSPWVDLFRARDPNPGFIEFCEKYFSLAGNNIKTVLQARWWFYANSKLPRWPARASTILNWDQPLVIPFYDTYDFEDYLFFNLNDIVLTDDYATYKFFLKKFIHEYDNDDDYLQNKKKENSTQIDTYMDKKVYIKNLDFIAVLSDGTRIATPNLPFLSEYEYRKKYQNSLQYLFNV